MKTAEHTDCQKLHLAAEKSIADCIQWLTTSEYLEDSIEYVLKIILDYYQADRVYIIEADEKKNAGVNTYEVCAKGVIPPDSESAGSADGSTVLLDEAVRYQGLYPN